MAFVEDGGYGDERWWRSADWMWIAEDHVSHPPFWEHDNGRWFWRGMFELIPLPASWPVYVSHAEAAAYARWKGRRLITEPEFHRAAYGTPSGTERTQPSEDGPVGYFDFLGFDPRPVGSYPQGVSAWGVHDLVGNGWEWTSTIFGPFPGFRPMSSYPEYSADFFDGQHYVMKGASPATAKELVRPSFRRQLSLRVREVQDRAKPVGRVSRPGDIEHAVDNRPFVSRVRCRGSARSCADAEAAAIEIPVRCARVDAIRSHLPAAVVSHHPR
jgi:formylglycine-generating enzyme required for sulfatase activity